jgi:hypothetical protein
MHRHDDVQEIILAYRPDYARRRVDASLQGDIGGFDDIQHFPQEAHIESN